MIFIFLFLVSLAVNVFLIKRKVEISIFEGSSERKGERLFTKSTSGEKTGIGFYNNFESGSTEGWKGKITKEITPQGSKYALQVPKVNNPYFATATSKRFQGRKLKIESNTRIEFDYFIRDGSVLRIQCYCPKRRDNFYFDIKGPATDEWKRCSVGFAAFKDNSHTGLTPQRGEEFSSIKIYGGRAGENTFLLIDNFQIVEGD